MAKITIILITLLAGCTSMSQPSIGSLSATIEQALRIPSGSTHLLFHAGEFGKGSRYTPYCRLDVKAPLEGDKQIQTDQYTGSNTHQRAVRDDLLNQPAFYRVSLFGFLDEENMFNMFSMDLSSENTSGMRLRCYQEFQSRFHARSFSLSDINAIVQPYLSLKQN